MASTVMTIARALTWWHSINHEEKLRLAKKYYPKEVEALGIRYVHKSNAWIEAIYKKEINIPPIAKS